MNLAENYFSCFNMEPFFSVSSSLRDNSGGLPVVLSEGIIMEIQVTFLFGLCLVVYNFVWQINNHVRWLWV